MYNERISYIAPCTCDEQGCQYLVITVSQDYMIKKHELKDFLLDFDHLIHKPGMADIWLDDSE